MSIDCPHPRPKLNMPGYTPPRFAWSPPTFLPATSLADLTRALTEQFRGVYAVLQQLGQRRAVVPLIEDIEARAGQVIVGVGAGQTIRLPQLPNGELGQVGVVLTDVSSPVLVVNPDGTTYELGVAGAYDFLAGSPEVFQTAPGGTTGSVTTDLIADDAVTDAKLAEMGPNTVKGNPTAGTANPVDIAIADLSVLGRMGVAGTGNLEDITVPDTATFTGESVFLRSSSLRTALQFRNLTLVDLPEILDNRFIGNISGATARPVYTDLGDLASDSIAYEIGGKTFIREELTGAIEAPQNVNATTFSAGASGAGLVGGGTAVLAVGAGTYVTVNANDVAVNRTALSADLDSTSVVDSSGTLQRAALTGAITAAQNSNATLFDANASGAGLTGGGTAVLAVGAGTNVTVSADAVSVDDFPLSGLADQAAETFVGNFTASSAAPTARAGSSVAGGGLTYTAGGTLAVGAGDGIDVAADAVAVDISDVIDGVSIEDDGSNNARRAALTGFAAASAGSNATTSAEPIVTFSASANMSNERVLSAGFQTAIDIATPGEIQVDWLGLEIETQNEGVLGNATNLAFINGVNTFAVGVNNGGGQMLVRYDVVDFPLTGLAAQADDTFLANISGGAAPPTAVALSTLAGDGIQGGANAVLNVDVSDFAGTGLEDDGSENLRIAASAAGAGLTGGGGSALAVGAGTHVTVNADDVAVNLTTLVPAVDSASVIANGTVLERAALTGDVTASQNSNSTTIANSAVTLAKLANQADDTFLANISGVSGPPSAVALTTLAGSGLTGGANAVLAVGAGTGITVNANDVAVTIPLTDGDKGDITVASSGTVWDIDANVVGNAELRQSVGFSVVGRSGSTTGNVADITASVAASLLKLNNSGTALVWGQAATASIEDDAVTDDKLRNSGALSVIGRSANSSGGPADISAVAASGGVLRESGSVVGFGTIALAAFPSIAADTVLANVTGSTAQPTAVTLTSLVNNSLSWDSTNNRFDYIGSTSNINVTPTGAVGVIDISALLCGGSVTLQPSADFNIAGFSTKGEGFWFDLVYRDTSTRIGTLNENDGAATTSIRNPGNVASTITTQEGARFRYQLSRWRVVARSVRGAALTDGDKGDVTVSSSGATWTIDNDVVTNAKAANMAQSTIKGRAAGAGTGDPTDLTPAQVVAIIDAEAVTWTGTHTFNGGSHIVDPTGTIQLLGGADMTLATTAGGLWISAGHTPVTSPSVSNNDILINATSGVAINAHASTPVTAVSDGAIAATCVYFSAITTGDILIAAGDTLTLSASSSVLIPSPSELGRPTFTGASFRSAIFSSTMAADLNNLAIGEVTVVRLDVNSASDRILTGMVPAGDGQVVYIFNTATTAGRLILANDTGSTAANRFLSPGTNHAIRPRGGVAAWYDGASDRWRLMVDSETDLA